MIDIRHKPSVLDRLSRGLAFYWPIVIVFIAVFVAIYVFDSLAEKSHIEDRRAAVADKLSPIRAQLEGNIKSDIKLLQSLAAVIETEQGMNQSRFSDIGRRLFSRPMRLNDISIVYDKTTALIYPYLPNQIMVGRTFSSNPSDIKAAELAEKYNTFIVARPNAASLKVNSLRIYYPIVFSANSASLGETADSSANSRGLLMGTIEVNRLFRESGLFDPSLNLNIALYDNTDGQTTPILGDTGLMDNPFLTMTVNIGAQSWVLAASPKEASRDLADERSKRRIVMFFLSFMILAPIMWVARLLEERQANIAELNEQKRELRTLSQRLQIALNASQIGVWELDIATGRLHWDARMLQLYGMNMKTNETDIEEWKRRVHPSDREATAKRFDNAIRTNTDYSTQFRIITDTGEIRHLRAFGAVYRDAHFRKKIVGVNWSVTADVKMQEDLQEAKNALELQNHALEDARLAMEHSSLHDPLTGLANRRYLDKHLAKVDNGRTNDHLTAVLHIDLDRFKDINDTLGHAAGDTMLRHVANQINAMIDETDFAARIGGDEFVVVCQGPPGEAEEKAKAMGEALISAINQPIPWQGQECRVGASIGIALIPKSLDSMELALINADIALYEAKRRGKNRLEFFSDTLKEATLSTKRTADAILRSLEQEEFIPYFQPQFDAHTLKIIGVEALARWQHPEDGLLAPNAFLSVAESLNVVANIDKTILEQSLRQAKRWADYGLDALHVSVNISAQRLFDDSMIERLADTTLPAGGLAFELLESISFDDKDEAAAVAIAKIKALGIEIEIDDFGTGYSSILSLLKLSPHRLKIDRQLTYPILESKPQRRLISSIVEIGKSLGIEIVAEGVETMAHAEILRDLGCHILQGYALAKPMSADDLFALMSKTSHKPLKNAVG
ncbi:EAL domain-containing protein [Rhizobium sp.]|jgi:diguanylate cyclase (GGDEF)-like protein|uniref:putative bifunctional diguanylate cyclase/phosphodiesterase n=1 Tax=Rhizobium sp. TaxID=391 RepID=UPI000E7F81EE|nr:bifunctional diguanylate cyclase/phosphodiesterase [Rhizobium sp.]